MVGYHASHEQHTPSALLADVRAAAEAGFGAISSSDHLSPWSSAQGESGFAWSWLGAAMETVRLPFGVVNAPGQRYHPAIIAQAIATLTEMYPGRLWVALGSGEASNEHVTGERWPAKAERNARLGECVEVIRALLCGEEVSVDGRVRVDRARLWTLPAAPPPLFGAALSEVTAAWCGGWADGLLTVHAAPERLQRVNSTPSGRVVAWASPYEFRSRSPGPTPRTRRWRERTSNGARTCSIPCSMADLETVDQFEAAAAHVRPDDVRSSVLISSDPKQHAAWLHEMLDLGVDEVYIHQVPREQRRFIEVFGAEVLPEVVAR